MKINSQ